MNIVCVSVDASHVSRFLLVNFIDGDDGASVRLYMMIMSHSVILIMYNRSEIIICHD